MRNEANAQRYRILPNVSLYYLQFLCVVLSNVFFFNRIYSSMIIFKSNISAVDNLDYPINFIRVNVSYLWSLFERFSLFFCRENYHFMVEIISKSLLRAEEGNSRLLLIRISSQCFHPFTRSLISFLVRFPPIAIVY